MRPWAKHRGPTLLAVADVELIWFWKVIIKEQKGYLKFTPAAQCDECFHLFNPRWLRLPLSLSEPAAQVLKGQQLAKFLVVLIADRTELLYRENVYPSNILDESGDGLFLLCFCSCWVDFCIGFCSFTMWMMALHAHHLSLINLTGSYENQKIQSRYRSEAVRQRMPLNL